MKLKSLPLLITCMVLSPSLFALTLDELTQQAKQGDAKAQYQLAQRFKTGDGVTQSAKDAFYWLDQAAQNGQLDASIELAQQAIDHSANPDDFAEHFYALIKLAASGDANAQTALAKLYQNEGIADIDPKQLAEVWYHIAAEKSDAASAAYSALLEQQFNQRRAKQIKQFNELEPVSAAKPADTQAEQNSAIWYQIALGISLLISALLALLLLKKKGAPHHSEHEQQISQLQATIHQQNSVMKQQKRQLETLFRQFKKLETQPAAVPKPEPKDHKLGLAASMFGFRASSLPDEKQIKTRYKQLCKIYHPDLKGTDEEMKRLNNALKILLVHVNK